MWREIIAVGGVIGVLSCRPPSSRAPQAGGQLDVPGRRMVGTLNGDSVFVVASDGAAKIEWTGLTREGRVARWTSRDLAGADPRVSIAYIDGDSIPDLFWSIDHDEAVGGMVLFGTAAGAR